MNQEKEDIVLVSLINFLKNNIDEILPNGEEALTSYESFKKYIYNDSDKTFIETHFERNPVIDINPSYIEKYLARISKLDNIVRFLNLIKYDFDSQYLAKLFIYIIRNIEHNCNVPDYILADDLNKTYIKREVSGVHRYFLVAISVEEEINITNEWSIKPLKYNDNTYITRDLEVTNCTYGAATAVLEIPFQCLTTEVHQRGYYLANKVIEFFNTCYVGHVETIRIRTDVDSCFYTDKTTHHGSISKINEIPEDLSSVYCYRIHIHKTDSHKLSSLWRKLQHLIPAENIDKYSIDSKTSPIYIISTLLARQRYSKVFFIDRYRSKFERIFLVINALEAIYSKNESEITYKLCQRCALLIGIVLGDAAEVYDNVNDAYSIRSKFVHGDSQLADSKFQKKYNFKALLDNNIRYAHRSILICYLILPQLIIEKKINNTTPVKGKDAFIYLLDKAMIDDLKREELHQLLKPIINMLPTYN